MYPVGFYDIMLPMQESRAANTSLLRRYRSCLHDLLLYDDNQKTSADVNRDGLINAVDASSILAYYAYVSTTTENIKTIEEFLK